ncbi:MAG: TonB-dependent receptor [Gammaproteobacteria bacterium]
MRNKIAEAVARLVRKRGIGAGFGALLATAGLSIAQDATAAIRSYAISAQPISTALMEFAAQSGLELMYTESDVGTVTTTGVKGELAPGEALAQILKGTNLEYSITSSNVVVVRKPAPAAPPRTQADFQGATIRLAQSESPSEQGASSGSSASAESEGGGTLAEVVVSAQKRLERLLDVPVPVTALAGQTLLQQNIVKLDNYAVRIPGLRVTGPFIGTIALRGVQSIGGGSPTVAVLIDDIPFGGLGRAVSQFPDLDPADLSRIEVLRGPQGTLYGASSLGGLIKLVTNQPNPDQWSGRIEAGGTHVEGGKDGYSLRGSINMPVISDMLAISASAYRRDDAPYIDNIIVAADPVRNNARVGTINAEDANAARYEGGRAALYFKAWEELRINISRLKQTRDSRNGGNTEVNSGTDLTPRFGYFKTTSGAVLAQNDNELTRASVDWDLPFATLTSISGWGRTSNTNLTESQTQLPYAFAPYAGLPPIYPGAPAGSFTRLNYTTSTKQFTQEVRLASSGDHKLEWMVGGFYDDEKSSFSQVFNGYTPARDLIGLVVSFRNPSTYEEKAIFGNVTYHFTDQFDVQVGGRYSKNEQTYLSSQDLPPSAVVYFGDPDAGTPLDTADTVTTWSFTPRYKLNDDAMVYARVASGYRPGGTNVLGAPLLAYDPDKVVNYEVGAKGYAFQRKVTYDVSLYDIEWNHIQLQTYTISGNQFTQNAGKARSYGFEGAVQYSPAADWIIAANVTLSRAKLVDDILPSAPGAPRVLGDAGDTLPNHADFTGTLGVDKTWTLFNGFRGTLGANVSYVGRREQTFNNTIYPVARQARLWAPSYTQLDLRALVTDDIWELSAFIRNVGSKHGAITVNQRAADPVPNVAFIDPQTFGVMLARKF